MAKTPKTPSSNNTSDKSLHRWTAADLDKLVKRLFPEEPQLEMWTPRGFTDKENRAIFYYGEPKFKEIVDEVKKLEPYGLPWGPFPIRIKKIRERNLRYHLRELGVDDEVIETLVKDHLRWQRYLPKLELGHRGILHRWARWFFVEVSGEKIFQITERPRPASPRDPKAAQLPTRVAAVITHALIKKHYPQYKAYIDQVEDLLKQYRPS